MVIYKKAVLDHIAGKQAVLLLENGVKLVLPKDELSDHQLGSEFRIQIMPEAEAALSQETLARTILNQILQTDNDGQTAQESPTGNRTGSTS